ncbi:MAG: thioredoxin [Lachnospiraceae bacterium]|nr:thioredoxin [Lachnospiraceae bacterium]
MKQKKEVPYWISLILLLAAVASCIFGLYSGEAKIVYGKAVKICMECIGIG